MKFRLVSLDFVSSTPEADDQTIAIVTLNRPERRNAFGPRMALEMDALFEQLRHSTARIVILTGAGGTFCAGGDLREETLPLEREEDAMGLKGEYADLLMWMLNDHFHLIAQRAFRKLEKLPQIVIAAIDGSAVGIGFEMTLACDLRIMTKRARLGELAIPAGFLSEWSAPRYLPQLIGLSRATEMILTGRMVHAEEAREIGLVHQIVPDEDLMDRALELARQLTRSPKLGLQFGKELLRMYADHNRSERALDTEMERVLEITRTEDCAERIRWFLAGKRGGGIAQEKPKRD
jgi:enoyl-CoA hydratase/carnithine racemase